MYIRKLQIGISITQKKVLYIKQMIKKLKKLESKLQLIKILIRIQVLGKIDIQIINFLKGFYEIY